MQNLEKFDALQIYKALYWDKIKGDQIKDQYLAEIIFDGQLQHGYNVKLLQQSVNRLGEYNLAEDNKFGPNTLAGLNHYAQYNPAVLYQSYKQRRKEYYLYLVDRTPTLDVFLDGWFNRINSFQDYSV